MQDNIFTTDHTVLWNFKHAQRLLNNLRKEDIKIYAVESILLDK